MGSRAVGLLHLLIAIKEITLVELELDKLIQKESLDFLKPYV